MSQTSIFFQEAKDLYFADESDILTVGSTDLATAIDVRVAIGDEEIASFSVDTFNGLAILPIGEILLSTGKRNAAEISSMTVELSQGEASASHTAKCVFCRRFTEEAAEMYSEWLTSGPAERSTCLGAAETLPFLADPGAISQNAMILVIFSDGSVQTRTFANISSMSGEGLDVSAESIRDFVRSQMLYAEIESYSLWIEYMAQDGSSRTGSPVKFILAKDRLERHTYKFVNYKGTWEYIHASGELKRSIETETGTFVTQGVETEISNDFTRIMEQNSGHIGSAAEAEFWLAFMASKERYVKEADGSERQIVVDDSSTAVTDMKVGEISFKWHYGNKNNTIINRVSIPVEGIEIAGDSVVDNDRNRLQLGIVYTPAATTQRGVVWQLIEGSEFASLSATGLLIVKEGADGDSVTVKAVSSHNGEIQATKTLTVTHHPEAAESYGLTVHSNVDSPVIALSIDGVAVEYFEGILIVEGQTVTITVSKSGYTTATRTITFSFEEKDQWFELVQSHDASVSYPATISKDAQEVAFHISDPSLHGWLLDYGDLWRYVTAYRATGGYTFINVDGCDGRGDAVVYLTFAANPNSGAITLSGTNFAFKDNTTQERNPLTIRQLGNSGVLVPVSSVDIPVEKSLALGASAQLSPVTVLPANADNKTLLWTSTDDTIVSVTQSGYITGRATGSATIRAAATDGSGHYADCYVTVYGETVHVNGIELNKSELSIIVGGSATLAASVKPSNASDKSIVWSSSDPTVATVTQNGKVTGVRLGVVTITVTSHDGGYTASCEVTVSPDGGTEPGEMSVDDMTVASVATSGSAAVRCENMEIASISAATTSPWITEITVDKSGSVPRVRLRFNDNRLSSTARTAEIQVSGTDLSGDPVTTSFTLTQRGYSTSDVPCTGMDIGGPDTIANSGNTAIYGVGYSPEGCTQTRATWSVISGASHVEVTTLGDGRLQVAVKPGADGDSVTLRATNYYNNNRFVDKTITVSFVEPSGISVSPANVTVLASDTSDQTPVVAATSIQAGSLFVKSVSGFISSASVQNGRLVTQFAANPTTSGRYGSVVLQAFDLEGQAITATVGYSQSGASPSGLDLEIIALNVAQTGGKVTAMVKVNYTNGGINQAVFGSAVLELTGKDSGGQTVFTRSANLPDKTVAGMITETEIYEVKWNETLGMSVEYVLQVTAGGLSDTYTGDGNDTI